MSCIVHAWRRCLGRLYLNQCARRFGTYTGQSYARIFFGVGCLFWCFCTSIFACVARHTGISHLPAISRIVLMSLTWPAWLCSLSCCCEYSMKVLLLVQPFLALSSCQRAMLSLFGSVRTCSSKLPPQLTPSCAPTSAGLLGLADLYSRVLVEPYYGLPCPLQSSDC